MFQQTSSTTSPTTLVTLYDDSYGSKDSDIDSDGGSEDSIIDDNEAESVYKSDSSDLDNELDYNYEISVMFTKIDRNSLETDLLFLNRNDLVNCSKMEQVRKHRQQWTLIQTSLI